MSGDRSEFVEVEFDKLIRQSHPDSHNKGAFLIEVDGDEFWVAKSQVDNVDDLMEDLELPEYKRQESSIEVPKWLAIENGWLEED